MVAFPSRSGATMPSHDNGVKNKNRTLVNVVIPALDAAVHLPRTLAALDGEKVVVVDGSSRDSTVAVARAHGARVISAPRGRGSQLAAGVAATEGGWLLLLHADTVLAPGWSAAARAHIAAEEGAAGAGRAAYFRFALDSADLRARRLERWVAWRCRVLALPYGDQGLLVPRALLDEVGGMRPLPLMEDVDLVRRIGGARLAALPVDAVTSAGRWERDGWRRRSLRNLGCLALWFAGVPPRTIARLYG
jgi:rSAM/selenodomain-associated transferase 2